MRINPRSLTFVIILTILGIETAIQLVNIFNPSLYPRQWAFVYLGLHDALGAEIGKSPIYAYFTYAFIHGGILHAGMNSLVTLQMGNMTEKAMGTKIFALFTLISAVVCGAGTLLWISMVRDGPYVLIGFSGVLFAYIGYYLRTALGRARDKQRFLTNFAKRNVLLIALIVVPLIFPQLGISGEAHLIGFVFGMLVAPLFVPKIRGEAEKV